ncbi:DNA helicase B [Lonchura striata]|uniref:DNA helicase B n=2 Tax=Lonchura striata TaxID=40157 RepID=A0A218V405_9PASE|nr:DNA helicase B isoform X1 [Lonchura striata domestica]OWK60724.1 DNA helicase B [Lonchura striata domestica]
MAAGGGQRGALLWLWGRLRPPRCEAADDEEESDEDFGELLAEEALLEPAGRELSAALPPRRAVIIQECGTKKEYEVVGRFPLVDPWWKVNVNAKKMGSKYFVQGYPSYFLQTDVEENNRQVFSHFLTECHVPEDWKEKFFAWLPMESVLSFSNLEEKLKQFQVSQLQPRGIQRDTKDYDIFYCVSKSFAGKAVLGALAFPRILEYLPILLPRHFCCLLDKMCWERKADMDGEEVADEMATKLDEILKDEPWKLGFSRIMYKELNIPYCEATWAAFCQCEHLLWKIPDLQKNALILYDQLKTRCRQMGHTYEDQDELARLVSKHMSIEHVWQSLEFLRDQNVVIRDKKLVFLPHLYKSEKDIAMYVGDLLSNHTWKLDVDVKKILSIPEAPRESADNKMNIAQACEREENNADDHNGENHFPEKEVGSVSGIQSKAEVDKDQVTAVKKICSNPVTIISGKGGCGKSTIVSCLFRHLMQMEKEVEAASKDFEGDLDASEEWNTFDHHWESENMYAKKHLNVLFTAPTGRATSLLREKTQLPAYTLHQIICSFKSWRRNNQEQPWKFSAVTVLIVDEGSLVSVHILSLVLKLLCEHAQLAKLIILGDTRQLPSIDPGNMLADIFEGLKPRGFTVELRTNHRAESQLIVDNASRISHRQLPEFDEVLKVSAWNEAITMPVPEKKFIFIALPAGGNCENLQTAIKTLLKKGPGLEDAKQSQFIAFRRQDCDLINELCCQHYSNHLTRDHKNRLLFQTGDKIASTRNVYLKDLLAACGVREGSNGQECRSGETTLTAESDEEGKRLCNGDIFFIRGDAEIDKQRLLTISSTYGSTYTVNYKALRKLCHIKHAWARTIHTFQGSEERTVVYVVGNAGRQHWQHVYTAVTRGRCRVYVVAEELHLRRAVKSKEITRKTRLQRFLREATAETNNCSKQMLSLPAKCWQSQELETQSVAPDPPEHENDLTIQEGSSVLSKEKTDSLQQSPCKRQIPASEDATKISPTTVQESPLGSSRLKNLTLGQQIPRKLFKS